MASNNADHMTQRMAEAGTGQAVMEGHEHEHPQKGEHYRCESCGMEVEVETGCGCKDDPAHFHCCGQPMHKA